MSFSIYKSEKKDFKMGFTLVETLMAISILSISILGTFTAVQKGLSTSMYARDQAAAFYLIQDAMEWVRNAKDTQQLSNLEAVQSGGSAVEWITPFKVSGSLCGLCKIDTYSSQLTETNDSEYLLQDSSTGFFGYDSFWTETKFIRQIEFSQPINADELLVLIRVKWQVFGGVEKEIIVKESMFNMMD